MTLMLVNQQYILNKVPWYIYLFVYFYKILFVYLSERKNAQEGEVAGRREKPSQDPGIMTI